MYEYVKKLFDDTFRTHELYISFIKNSLKFIYLKVGVKDVHIYHPKRKRDNARTTILELSCVFPKAILLPILCVCIYVHCTIFFLNFIFMPLTWFHRRGDVRRRNLLPTHIEEKKYFFETFKI